LFCIDYQDKSLVLRFKQEVKNYIIMKKSLFYLILTFTFFVFGSANVSAQSTISSKTDNANNVIKEYKLEHKTTAKKVEKMDFDKIIELVPTQLQQDLWSSYDSKDNYDKEKMLNSIKLMIQKHIKETN